MLKKTSSMESPLNFEQWGVKEWCQYLQKEGHGKWEDTFREKNITSNRMLSLTDTDLEEMGITPSVIRQKILHSIRKLWQMKSKVFNDPIHGHMELHPLLIKIIDTPQFQRLRNIKQLGGAYFVYPGASHNRFEHSIGVGHLAGQLVQALSTVQPELGITERDILCVKIAGLCHDLGHGPFSHLFDKMFIAKMRPGRNWKHEEASVKMFDHLVKSNKLEPIMTNHGLVLEEDLVFIKELIVGPLNSQAASDEWPYEGRTKDKSFLYEIVANKTNGIDVDKFDYFARDCYHLGIQNNFDYHRFIKFARVCEVDGQKHICTRDKEVDNMYDMFHTRCYLHRAAYQHNVNKLIETMIADAFVEADEHIQIEGSGGEMFKLSTAIDDMKAYTKLTDHVFEQILNSSSPELAKAREILGRIITRDLYKLLGKCQPDQPIKVSEEIISRWKEDLAQAFPQNDTPGDTLTSEDFEVTVITVDYGMKGKDPIKNMYFYSKNDLTTAFRLPKEQESKIRPKCFSEQLINVYCKKTDDQSLKTAQEHFDQWYKNMGFPRRQDGDTVTPELPEENIQNN